MGKGLSLKLMAAAAASSAGCVSANSDPGAAPAPNPASAPGEAAPVSRPEVSPDLVRANVPDGINDSWVDSTGAEAAGRLERDGREVYAARTEILGALALTPGQAVADIGAGSGLFTRLFSDAVGPSGEVYAVDIGEKMLADIAAAAKKDGRTNIRTRLGTDRTTHLPADSVDVVFISDTYHHFEYPMAMMRSIRQAMRADAKLVVIDFERIEGQSSQWLLKHVRAGKAQVIQEIESAGFRRTATVELDGLTENYFVVFEKIGT